MHTSTTWHIPTLSKLRKYYRNKRRHKRRKREKGERKEKKLKESRQASCLGEELVCGYNPNNKQKDWDFEISLRNNENLWQWWRKPKKKKKILKRTMERKRKEATRRKGRGAAATTKCQVIVMPVIINIEDTEKETCTSELYSKFQGIEILRSCLNKRNLFKEERKAKWRWGWKAGSMKEHLPSTCRPGFDPIQQGKEKENIRKIT